MLEAAGGEDGDTTLDTVTAGGHQQSEQAQSGDPQRFRYACPSNNILLVKRDHN